MSRVEYGIYTCLSKSRDQEIFQSDCGARGDAFLLRTVLAVLSTLEHSLYGTEQEIIKVLSNEANAWDKFVEEDKFVATIRDAWCF